MEFRDKQAIYLQIAEYISEQILLNRWPAGDRLPSVRDLAAELAVNPNTIMRTIDFLNQKEIITNKRGIGNFITDDAENRIKAFRREQFMEAELPQLFRNMYLLGIDLNEIGNRYTAFIESNFNHTSHEKNENQ
nr:GntR family transcriptional regulator [uncultured Arsenicibacter sp.]